MAVVRVLLISAADPARFGNSRGLFSLCCWSTPEPPLSKFSALHEQHMSIVGVDHLLSTRR